MERASQLNGPCAPASVVDAWPHHVTLRAVEGDMFSFRLVLRDRDENVVDVSAWTWAATVTTGRLRLDWEWAADEGGVRFWLRGDDTARLGTGKGWPFDVTGRQPAAGEGLVVLAGEMFIKARVTAPLRGDPDEVPA